MSDDAYKFDTAHDPNAWEAIKRLGDEINWPIPTLDDGAVERLRAFTRRRQASRAQVTRAEFIASLCRDAGVDPPPMAGLL